MKKAILFTLFLSIAGCFLAGCNGGDDTKGDNAAVNTQSTIKPDASKPAAKDNPGGQTTFSAK